MRIATRADCADEAGQLSFLIDPVKLATLGKRGANPRVRKITAILFDAKAKGADPAVVAKEACKIIGWTDARGELTAAAMVRNLTIIERLGSTTEEDLAKLRRGNAPTVRKGPYAGQIISVDHIIPRSVCPELDNVIANLELMPLGLNQGKADKITSRQVDFARKMRDAGLLSAAGNAEVQRSASAQQ